jgi:hypothetical protein
MLPKISHRVIRKLRRLGYLETGIDVPPATDYDPLLDDEPELERSMAASVRQRITAKTVYGNVLNTAAPIVDSNWWRHAAPRFWLVDVLLPLRRVENMLLLHRGAQQTATAIAPLADGGVRLHTSALRGRRLSATPRQLTIARCRFPHLTIGFGQQTEIIGQFHLGFHRPVGLQPLLHPCDTGGGLSLCDQGPGV